MKWFVLAWLICGVISYIYGALKHGDESGTPFFLIYIVLVGPIGLFIQIAERYREVRNESVRNSKRIKSYY